MPELERAKLIPVEGPNDRPNTGEAISVQFNPATLRVALANTLKANSREGGSRSAQFVDKSSSSLTIDLSFDTTKDGSDVREKTKEIALKFLKPEGEGDQMRAPKRCLFQWGAFEFIGLLQTFNETLDYFSPEGRPLRASVALKLSEDRFQFRTRSVADTERETPTLTPTGSTGDTEQPSQAATPVNQANAQAGRPQKDWRDTAVFNGIENPRLPRSGLLAVPRPGSDLASNAAASVGRHLMGADQEGVGRRASGTPSGPASGVGFD